VISQEDVREHRILKEGEEICDYDVIQRGNGE
jgi:hypothetical protein